MPIECTYPACREDILKTINHKVKEVRCRLESMVSAKILIWTLASFISISGIISGLAYTAYSREQDKKEQQITDCQKSTQIMKTNMAVMQRDLEDIKAQLEKQGLSQEKILDILMDLKRGTSVIQP